MQETKITMDRVKNHFTYSWWKYALLAVLAVFGWNLVYTSTAYRPPKDKKLDVYFVSHTVDSENLEWLKARTLENFPELEDAGFVSISYTEEDSYYGSMQLTTYIGAGEGDIYIMTRERFDAFKGSGTFLALDEAIASGDIDLRGIDAGSTTATDEDGNRGVFGIPAQSLYGLMEHGIDNRDLVICVMVYSQNQYTAIQFVDWLVENMRAEKPDWLAEYEAQQQQSGVTQEISDIPSY